MAFSPLATLSTKSLFTCERYQEVSASTQGRWIWAGRDCKCGLASTVGHARDNAVGQSIPVTHACNAMERLAIHRTTVILEFGPIAIAPEYRISRPKSIHAISTKAKARTRIPERHHTRYISSVQGQKRTSRGVGGIHPKDTRLHEQNPVVIEDGPAHSKGIARAYTASAYTASA